MKEKSVIDEVALEAPGIVSERIFRSGYTVIGAEWDSDSGVVRLYIENRASDHLERCWFVVVRVGDEIPLSGSIVGRTGIIETEGAPYFVYRVPQPEEPGEK